MLRLSECWRCLEHDDEEFHQFRRNLWDRASSEP